MCRKLDARVAEVVMGWTNDSFHWYNPITKKAQMVPNYSTDHNAAFEVEKRLLVEGWYVETRSRPGPSKSKVFLQRYIENGHPEDIEELMQLAADRPTALCLIALRAKGDHEGVDKHLKEAVCGES